ncbi:MAG TPA: hypothetical protein VLL52_01445 [Anaerolineae bacterium]|nr:hypothetical protein [Anaerolineae bacterium]
MSEFGSDEARRRAEAAGWSVARVVAEIERVVVDWIDFLAVYQPMGEALAVELRPLVGGEVSWRLLQVAVMLLYLGDEAGNEPFLRCLREGDEALQKKAVQKLAFMPLQEGMHRGEVVVPLAQADVLAILRPWLMGKEQMEWGEMKEGMVWRGLCGVLNLKVDEVADVVAPFLQHRDVRVRLQVMHWFALEGNKLIGLVAAREMVLEEGLSWGDRHSLMTKVSVYGRRAVREEVRAEVGEVAALYVRRYGHHRGETKWEGVEIANSLMTALRCLADVGYGDIVSLLAYVWSAPVTDMRRGEVLRQLAMRDGERWLPVVLTSLADEDLRRAAVAAVGGMGMVAERDDVRAALLAVLGSEGRKGVQDSIVQTLMKIGGDLLTVYKLLGEELSPSTRMNLYWLLQGITPRQAAAKLATAGIIGEIDEGELAVLEKRWEEERVAGMLGLLALGARLVWFDAESGMVTPDYDKLLAQFVEVAGEVLPLEGIVQTVTGEGEVIEVTFVCDERGYRLVPTYLGDWYDILSVYELLNHVLAERGRVERWIPVYTGDQTAAFVLAEPIAFGQVANELHLALEESVRSAMVRGMVFEDYVRQLVAEHDGGG